MPSLRGHTSTASTTSASLPERLVAGLELLRGTVGHEPSRRICELLRTLTLSSRISCRPCERELDSRGLWHERTMDDVIICGNSPAALLDLFYVAIGKHLLGMRDLDGRGTI